MSLSHPPRQGVAAPRPALVWTTAESAARLLDRGLPLRASPTGEPTSLAAAPPPYPVPPHPVYCAQHGLLCVNFEDAVHAYRSAVFPDLPSLACLFVKNYIRGFSPVSVIQDVQAHLELSYRIVALAHSEDGRPFQAPQMNVKGFKGLQTLLPTWLWVTKGEAERQVQSGGGRLERA